MDRERGETHLRLLAEAELRRTAAQPWDPAGAAGGAERVTRVAQLLVAVRGLDPERRPHEARIPWL